MKQKVKRIISAIPGISKIRIGRYVYSKYKLLYPINYHKFLWNNWSQLEFLKCEQSKAKQIYHLLKRVNIVPVNSKTFFYSIDCYKLPDQKNSMLINYTTNYDFIVNNSFESLLKKIDDDTYFANEEKLIINGLKEYINRCRESVDIRRKFSRQLEAIDTMFKRPANTLFEGLQRILFFNQVLWQTKHQHNGLGRLDYILNRVYIKELKKGTITREKAKNLIKEFISILHEYYWFKSGLMLGDTGQIIIIGGKTMNEQYFCNDLSYIFIEAIIELKLPEPKILLRYSDSIPKDLMKISLYSITTGIGSPLLNNDDYIINDLINFGYSEEDSYNYSASACWEPLITDNSADLNNIASFNFAIPFIKMLNNFNNTNINSFNDVLKQYLKFLNVYIKEILDPLTKLQFETDPLLSLVSTNCLNKGCDISDGGAKYYNLGLTGVGIGTVINSLLNIEKIVFNERKYSFSELNTIRKKDFLHEENLLKDLANIRPCYGEDDARVVQLTNYITKEASKEFGKYNTKFGGKFKFGLSSPYYIEDANFIEATLDGRKDGDPFNVHISANSSIPLTSLLMFGSKLDYTNNRFNGNVVDFILTPSFIRENFEKMLLLIENGMKYGIYQMQINVVDSGTLIAAKNNPELFPDLIVRVWGFSAYFNDLPESYKNVLITRALDAEKIY